MKLFEMYNKDSFATFISHLGIDCSAFLSVADDLTFPLYKGIQLNGRSLDFFEKRIRKNRMPLDATILETFLFNLGFEYFHNIPFVRTSSTFITTSIGAAGRYGIVYYAFPTNQSKLIYDPTVTDSIMNVNDIGSFFSNMVPDDNDMLSKVKSVAHNHLHEANVSYVKNNFPEVWGYVKQFMDERGREYFDGYIITTPDKADSIRDPHEIMLYGAPSFYAVKTYIMPYERIIHRAKEASQTNM